MNRNNRKRTVLLGLCLILTGCAAHGPDLEEAAQDIAPANGANGVPSPFVSCATMDEASKQTGFGLKTPDDPEFEEVKDLSVMDDQMIQIIFNSPECGEIAVRKGKGSEDISGDYNTYNNEYIEDLSGYEVKLRANDQDVYGATWQKDGYTYSVMFEKPATKQEVLDWVEEIA